MWEIIINNNSNNVLGSIITGLFTFFTGLIAIVVVRKQLRDSLDSKSGWRQELFKVSSKSRLLSDDVYILYTVLRFRPHDEAKKKDYTSMPPENFNEMTAYIFKELGAIEKNIDTGIQCIEYSDDEQKKYLNQKDSRKLRLFARYLLKNHWETLGNGWLKRWYWHKFEEKKMISDFYYLIKENDKEVEEN